LLINYDLLPNPNEVALVFNKEGFSYNEGLRYFINLLNVLDVREASRSSEGVHLFGFRSIHRGEVDVIKEIIFWLGHDVYFFYFIFIFV
jgi:hypothetical protein